MKKKVLLVVLVLVLLLGLGVGVYADPNDPPLKPNSVHPVTELY